MDETLYPFDFGVGGSIDPRNDAWQIPGQGTYTAPGAESSFGSMRTSQVPGTSGAPSYTPSATSSVASGAGSDYAPPPSSPWGSLAGLLGLNAPQTMAGAMKPGQGMKIAQLGMRMLAPPASPIWQGAPPQQLSSAGQNPLIAQFQQMYGVDYQTALAMMSMLRPGATAMTPQQQSQNVFAGAAFQPPQAAPSPLLPSRNLPTAAFPYGAQRMDMANANLQLPPLGQGAFPSVSGMGGLSSQMLYGSLTPTG